MQNMLRNVWQTLRQNGRKSVIAAGITAMLLIAVIVVLLSLGGKDRLKGRWSLDGVTVYEFSGDGSGALLLDTRAYPFHYRTDGDRLTIDFVSESAADREYTYHVQNKTLVLTFGQQRYKMTKQ